MGGWGSGRQGAANCTDSCRSLDVRRWQRDGLLAPGRWFNWLWMTNEETVANIHVQSEEGCVRLNYRFRQNGGEWQSMNYFVCLTTTPCNYGGERYWFICPVAGCNRRVALLYGYDEIFACRHCYQLVYRSQRETDNDRVIRQAEKIRSRLGWKPGILNPNGDKPNGMHWNTYFRLQAEHDALVERSLCELMAKFRPISGG